MRMWCASGAFRGGLRQVGLLLVVPLLVSGVAGGAAAQSEASLGMQPATSTGSSRVVLEGEWARWLARELGVTGIFPGQPPIEDVLSLLCADRGQEDAAGTLRRVQETSPAAGGRMRFRVDVEKTALYQLAVEGHGRQRWTLDGHVIEHIDPGGTGIAMPSRLLPLRAGPHELEVFLGSGGRVDRIDLSVFRPVCIAPVDGWHAERPLSHAAAARTLVRAMGLVPLLPSAGEPIALDGAADSLRTEEGRFLEARVHEAGHEPALLEYPVSIDEPGMHTIAARVRGPGEQVFTLDERYRSRVRIGDVDVRDVHVMSMPLASGHHMIRVLVPPGGAVEEIRFTRHGTRGSDELALVSRLGLPARAPAALVTLAEATRHLEARVFAERTQGFLTRESVRGPAEPVVLAEREREFIERPLSPALPAEL